MERIADLPQTVGDFDLRDLLGTGGTAAVYAAVHRPSGTAVALKVLRPALSGHAELRSAFLREAERTAAAEHPGVVRVLGRGQSGLPAPQAWIAFEQVAGRTLSAHVREHGPLTPRDALILAAALVEALDAAHAQGIVHRDVTPANVLIAMEAGVPLDPSRVRLIDFGLADVPGAAAVSVSDGDASVLGNPHFISPEQAQGLPVTEASDLYQLGGLLHFALTAAPPFRRDDLVTTMRAHVSDDPTPPSRLAPGIAPEIDAIALRSLAKDPRERYPSARAMLAAIRGAAAFASPTEVDTDRLPLIAPAGIAPERTRSRRRIEPRGRRPWLLAAAGITVFAAALGLAVVASLQSSLTLGVDSVSALPAPAPEKARQSVSAPLDDPPRTPRPRPSPGPLEKAADPVPVPELLGLSLEEARTRLARSGLALGPVTRVPSSSAAETVLETSRPSGAAVRPGIRIGLTVASGANAIPVLAGLSGEQAVATLESAGFSVVLPEAPADPLAVVTDSTPATGEIAALDSPVLLSFEPAETPDPAPAAGSSIPLHLPFMQRASIAPTPFTFLTHPVHTRSLP